MRFAHEIRRGTWIFAALAASGLAFAAEPPPMTPRNPVKALSDDKCVAQCDQESDKCMLAAGKDTAKQRECDATYTACLPKCG
jgi:hypothetical protein